MLADDQPSGGRLRGLDGGLSARQTRVALTSAGEAVEAALVETPRFVPAVSLERAADGKFCLTDWFRGGRD